MAIKSDVLIRVADPRLRYNVLLEERIRQLEVVLEEAADSVDYVRISGELENLWQLSHAQLETLGWLLAGRWGTCRPRGEGTTRPTSARGGTRADDDR